MLAKSDRNTSGFCGVFTKHQHGPRMDRVVGDERHFFSGWDRDETEGKVRMGFNFIALKAYAVGTHFFDPILILLLHVATDI